MSSARIKKMTIWTGESADDEYTIPRGTIEYESDGATIHIEHKAWPAVKKRPTGWGVVVTDKTGDVHHGEVTGYEQRPSKMTLTTETVGC